MSLADELHQTNEMLRSALGGPSQPVRGTERPREAQIRPGGRVSPSTALIAAHDFFGMNILRDHFKVVPESFLERSSKDVTIACPCGESVTVFYRQMVTCACRRVFFNGKSVHAAPPPHVDEILLCDNCGEETRVGDSEWVKVNGRECLVCPSCIRDVPE